MTEDRTVKAGIMGWSLRTINGTEYLVVRVPTWSIRSLRAAIRTAEILGYNARAHQRYDEGREHLFYAFRQTRKTILQ